MCLQWISYRPGAIIKEAPLQKLLEVIMPDAFEPPAQLGVRMCTSDSNGDQRFQPTPEHL